MPENIFAINRQTSNLFLVKTTDVRSSIRPPLIIERDRHDSCCQMQGMCLHISFYDPDRPIRIWHDANTRGQDREICPKCGKISKYKPQITTGSRGRRSLEIEYELSFRYGSLFFITHFSRLTVSEKSNISLLSLFDRHKLSYLFVHRPY